MTDSEPYSAGVTTDATDAAPAPDDAAPSGPDVGKTWGLSDEAASALYPDVDDAEPQQVDPAAAQVPPPFAQRPSPLLDIVRMYGSGHTDWPQTKQALIDFDYAPLPAPTGAPTGPTAGQWYADVENNAQGPEIPGSWPELVAAADHGMITQAELDEVLAARAGGGQDGGGGQPAAPGPTEGKAWSEAARVASLASRRAHMHVHYRGFSDSADQAVQAVDEVGNDAYTEDHEAVAVHATRAAEALGAGDVDAARAHLDQAADHASFIGDRSLSRHTDAMDRHLRAIVDDADVDVQAPDRVTYPTAESAAPFVGQHVTVTQSGYHTGGTASPKRQPISGVLRIEHRDLPFGRVAHAVVKDVDGNERSMRLAEVGSIRRTT